MLVPSSAICWALVRTNGRAASCAMANRVKPTAANDHSTADSGGQHRDALLAVKHFTILRTYRTRRSGGHHPFRLLNHPFGLAESGDVHRVRNALSRESTTQPETQIHDHAP